MKHLRSIITIFIILCCTRLAFGTDTLSINVHKQLDEITVNGQRHLPGKQPNYTIVYPESNTSYRQSTLYDMLRTIPSLDSDMEGNIKLRGSDKVTILIDGQPASLMGDYRSEVLIQLPASGIERIEVNNMPTAASVADGTAGTINIVLKKNDSQKPSGDISLNVANDKRYQAGAAFATAIRKLQLSASLDYKKDYRERSFLNQTINYPNDETKRSEQAQNNTAVARPETLMGNLVLAYEISTRDILGANLSFYQTGFNRIGNIQNITAPGTPQEKIAKVMRDNDQTSRDAGTQVYYRHMFGVSGHELRASIAYRNSLYDENNEYNRNNIKRDRLFIDQQTDDYNVNIDYRHPFGQYGTLNTGFSSRINQADNKQLKEDLKADEWIPSADVTNSFRFDRQIHALYLQYQVLLADFTIGAGVRGEYTGRAITPDTGESGYHKSYFNLFPNVAVGYSFSDHHKINLDYGRRINRPTAADLNPFINTSDLVNNRQGNPWLTPELIDNVALSYACTLPAFSITPTLFYRNRNHAIAELLQPGDQKGLITMQNLLSNQTAGVELATEIRPLKWLDLRLNGTVYHDEIDARNLQQGSNKGDWSYNLQGTVNISLTKTTLLQCNAFYTSDVLTPQGYAESRYRVDLGLRQQVMKGKGEVTLNVNDWFNTSKEITVIDTPSLYKKTEKSRDSRVIWLGFSYRFQ